MVTEYVKYENVENGWELHEIRTFDRDEKMSDVLLLVISSNTKEVVINEQLQDDVWQFEWDAVTQLEKFEEMTIGQVKVLKNLS